MLKDLLDSWGHDVAVASDGVEALERAASFVPEVVLLDIGLPRLDGYEVARRLRGARVDPVPLLVAVTGYGQEDDRRRASDAGFDGLLVKPVAVRDLREVIDRGISQRQASGRQRRSSS
jgi:CheY-like chemotaxis protein